MVRAEQKFAPFAQERRSEQMNKIAITYATTGMTLGLQIVGVPPAALGAQTLFDGDNLRKIDPKFQGKRFHQYLTAAYALKVFARDRLRRSSFALPYAGYSTSGQ
jgi:hypothetical protein